MRIIAEQPTDRLQFQNQRLTNRRRGRRAPQKIALGILNRHPIAQQLTQQIAGARQQWAVE